MENKYILLNESGNQIFRDTITLNMVSHLSFKERLLLLFRPLHMTVKIDCEHEPGATVSRGGQAWAARWRWPWQHKGGYGTIEPKTAEISSNG